MSKRAKTVVFIVLLAIICAGVYLLTSSAPKGCNGEVRFNIDVKENETEVHGMSVEPGAAFDKADLKIEGDSAYITAYYYDYPFFRFNDEHSGEFSVCFDNSEGKIREIYITDGHKDVLLAKLTDSGEFGLKRVVEGMFTELSKAEYGDIKSGSDGAGEVQTTENTVNTALQPWVYERFEPYMTEECFDRFIASAEYDIPYMAYIHVVDMEVTDFEMTVTDDGYDFTAKVVLKSFGNPINKDISGSAQLDENGKLEYFKVRGEEDVTVYFALSSQLRFD